MIQVQKSKWVFSKDVPDILNQICKSLKYKWASPHPPGRDKPLLSFLLPPKIFLLVQYWISAPTKNIPACTIFNFKKCSAPTKYEILLPQNFWMIKSLSLQKYPPKKICVPTNFSIIKPFPKKYWIIMSDLTKIFLVWWRRSSYFSGSKLV